jgi:hypothetical protein
VLLLLPQVQESAPAYYQPGSAPVSRFQCGSRGRGHGGGQAVCGDRPEPARGVLHRERAAKMSIPAKQDEVEELCRRALQEYRQEGLRERLSEKWPYDRTVKDRISYDYPPTFQPGYVGPHYFASRRRDSS